MRRSYMTVGIIVVLLAPLLLFQNCGEGFKTKFDDPNSMLSKDSLASLSESNEESPPLIHCIDVPMDVVGVSLRAPGAYQIQIHMDDPYTFRIWLGDTEKETWDLETNHIFVQQTLTVIEDLRGKNVCGEAEGDSDLVLLTNGGTPVPFPKYVPLPLNFSPNWSYYSLDDFLELSAEPYVTAEQSE